MWRLNYKPMLLATIILLNTSGCSVQKQLVPTGGSRSDGIVNMSFEYGLFETPQINAQQGLSSAKQRCLAWGYKDAEPFGGSTRSCTNFGRNGCTRWLVTVEYQCTS